ncbi:hypothetical protein [Marinomonas fungiae]
MDEAEANNFKPKLVYATKTIRLSAQRIRSCSS